MSETVYFGFTGMIDSASVTKICANLNIAANQGSPIVLCLSSPGGSVSDGVYLYNHIRALRTELTIHVTGSALSIAVAIMAGAPIRLASKYAQFMIHGTTFGPMNERLSGERLSSLYKGALVEDERTDAILRERTKLPEEMLKAKLSRETYLSPEEALKFGLIHEIREFAIPEGAKLIQV